MAGSKESARKSAKTLKEKYGADYYRHIGAKGGSTTGESKIRDLKRNEHGRFVKNEHTN